MKEPGPANSVENRPLRKKFLSSDRGSNLTVRQVFFMHNKIDLHLEHDPEDSKHVGKNLATLI